MKHELLGWSIGKDKLNDDTRQYHAIVALPDNRSGAACNHGRKVSGQLEKAVPEGANICGTCQKIVPTFICVEYHSGFAVRHARTGKEHWMSDGVDVLFDKNDKALSPGSPGFREKWEEALNSTGSETMEAYFPDLYAAGVED
jgi:hypothetical protein